MEMNLTEISRSYQHFINLAMIDDNSIVVDAGACEGAFIENIRAYRQGNKCRIIAIEPNRGHAEQLRNRRLPGVTVLEMALTGKDYGGKVLFYEHFELPEWGNIFKFFPTKNKKGEIRSYQTYMVKTFMINDIFSELKIDRIDFLKVDIEGAEGEVLDEMTEETASKITQIFVEGHKSFPKIIAPDMKRRLTILGFEVQILRDKIDVYGVRRHGVQI